MKSNFLIILTFLICSPFAQADMFDRIDSCEKSGDRKCIFQILRELAGKTASHKNACSCEAKKGESVSSDCFMKYESRLSIDGNIIDIKCARTKDQAYVDCMKRMQENKVCR